MSGYGFGHSLFVRHIPIDGGVPPNLVSITVPINGLTAEWKFDKDMDSNLTGKEDELSITGHTITGLSLLEGDPTVIVGALGEAVEFGEVLTSSYVKGTILAEDGGVLESFTNQAVTNSSDVMPGNDEFYSWLKNTAVEHADHFFYIEDSIGNNDSKITKSTGLKFDSNSSNINVTTIESAVTLKDGDTTIYKLRGFRLDDITRSSANWYDNCILKNGTDIASYKGIYISTNTDKLRVRIADGTNIATYTTTYAFANNTDIHYVEVKFNAVTKLLTVTIDDTVETSTLSTLTGSTFATSGKTTVIGNSGLTGRFTLGAFEVMQAGVTTALVTMCNTNYTWDAVSGTQFTVSSISNTALQDHYHAKVALGWQDYKQNSGSAHIYVPYKTDGTKIDPSISGYSKLADYPAGVHNYCESKLLINGTEYTSTELTTYPFKKNFAKLTASNISEIIVYTADQPVQVKERAFAFLGYTIFDMSIIKGDSIAAGIYADYRELSGTPDYTGYDDSITGEKVWNVHTQVWENVTIYNMQQPIVGNSCTGSITSTLGSTAVTGSGTAFTTELAVGDKLIDGVGTNYYVGIVASITDNTHLTLLSNAQTALTGSVFKKAEVPFSFSPGLGMAKYRNNGRIIMYAVGGTYCATQWAPGGTYDLLLKTNLQAAYLAAMKEGYYPHMAGVYVCLGTNDALNATYRDAIATNAAAMINADRVWFDESPDYHWLLPRSNDADRTIVRNLLLAMSSPSGVYWYESDDLSYYDSVHPNHAGTIALGEMWYLETWLDGTDF